ncbi:hypothetical protein [Vibrio marisflavi]|uniref:Uncharacterized protein n=1 Tax=Vibrio marisflavi CECT 7928 TaxID=634439 RepID=A0ABN8E0I6_9VIBR|nr:hypothetical protein [Vibrio marisflavi]CAH0536575.1 hypothetical protein VMF7928_00528 [Vibrio marisflavi CECT 7928]
MSVNTDKSQDLNDEHEHFYELWDSTFMLDNDSTELPLNLDESHD